MFILKALLPLSLDSEYRSDDELYPWNIRPDIPTRKLTDSQKLTKQTGAPFANIINFNPTMDK